jgi:hypothetical protein
MKKLMNILMILLLTTGGLFAQNQKGMGNQPGQMKEMNDLAKTELDLSDEQADQWDAIHSNYFTELDNLRADNSLSKEEKSAKMKVIRKTKDEEIKALLSNDQLKKFDEIRREMRSNKQASLRGPNQKPGMGPGPENARERGDRMKSELGLSDEQAKEWDEIQAAYRSKMHDIMIDDSLDREVKNASRDELKEEMAGELMMILDDKQVELFKARMEHRAKGIKQNRSENNN